LGSSFFRIENNQATAGTVALGERMGSSAFKTLQQSRARYKHFVGVKTGACDE
jgi:hypothetical protein